MSPTNGKMRPPISFTKNKDRFDCNNYTGISAVAHASKVLFIEKNKKNASCEHNRWVVETENRRVLPLAVTANKGEISPRNTAVWLPSGAINSGYAAVRRAPTPRTRTREGNPLVYMLHRPTESV